MRIIISPAKRMKVDQDSFPCRNLPLFLPQTEALLRKLRGLSYQELKNLWKCNDQIAQLNYQRLQTMELQQHLTPAILSYDGIQYQYMAPGVFTGRELEYIEEHLRVLSGFYGILRPFDGVTPYRLEMQAKLETERGKDLYAFWGDRISTAIFEETSCVINLASKEYSLCVSRHLPEDASFITCTFGERRGDSIVEKGTACKMARGEMVRYMAELQIKRPEELKCFERLNYRFSQEDSTSQNYVFIKIL